MVMIMVIDGYEYKYSHVGAAHKILWRADVGPKNA